MLRVLIRGGIAPKMYIVVVGGNKILSVLIEIY